MLCVCVHCTCVCTNIDFQLSKLKVTFVCRDKDERSLQKTSRQQHHLCILVKYHSPLKHTNSFIKHLRNSTSQRQSPSQQPCNEAPPRHQPAAMQGGHPDTSQQPCRRATHPDNSCNHAYTSTDREASSVACQVLCICFLEEEWLTTSLL